MLRHPLGGKLLPGEAGGLHPGGAFRAVRPGPAPQRHHPGYAEPGDPGGGPFPGAVPGDTPEPPKRGADHPPYEPAGVFHPGKMHLLPHRGGMPQLLHHHEVPQRQQPPDVPLLRLQRPGAGKLPRLRERVYEVHRPGHPAGGGGAPGAMAPGPRPADGHGHHHAPGFPRAAAGAVPGGGIRHYGGDPDGGQGAGLPKRHPGGGADGGPDALQRGLPELRAHLFPGDPGGGTVRPGGEAGAGLYPDLHPGKPHPPGRRQPELPGFLPGGDSEPEIPPLPPFLQALLRGHHGGGAGGDGEGRQGGAGAAEKASPGGISGAAGAAAGPFPGGGVPGSRALPVQNPD